MRVCRVGGNIRGRCLPPAPPTPPPPPAPLPNSDSQYECDLINFTVAPNALLLYELHVVIGGTPLSVGVFSSIEEAEAK